MLHDVSFDEVVGHLRDADPAWFLAAIAAATLTFPLRTVRWRYLLYFEGAALPFGPLWHATAIGFMANNLLPARAGELARAFAVQRLTGVRFSTAFASIAMERIFDGITLVAFLTVATVVGGFAPDATVAGMRVARLASLGGLLFGALLLGSVAVVRWPGPMLALARRVLSAVFPATWADRVTEVIGGMVDGLSALRAPGRLAAVTFWSLVVWLTNAASFWLAFRAFGIDASWPAALLLQSVIAFGVAIPSSPGYFGIFEGAARASLALYGIAAGRSVSFAIGYHIGGFIPITVLGLYSLWRAGLGMGELAGRRGTKGDEPGRAETKRVEGR